METITLEFLKNYFDENGTYAFFQDDALAAVFGESLFAVFRKDEHKIKLNAFSMNEKHKRPRAEALEICNNWNQETIGLKVCYDDEDDSFCCKNVLIIGGEISEEFAIQNFVLLNMAAAYKFFEQLEE